MEGWVQTRRLAHGWTGGASLQGSGLLLLLCGSWVCGCCCVAQLQPQQMCSSYGCCVAWKLRVLLALPRKGPASHDAYSMQGVSYDMQGGWSG